MSHIPRPIPEKLRDLEPNSHAFTGSLPHITSSSGREYYAKLGSIAEREQYEGEAEALRHMATAAPGLAPQLLSLGTRDDGRPWMISEYKNLRSIGDPAARRLGERLALEMHAHTSSSGFGFGIPTHCGPTRLSNGWFDSWDQCFAALIGELLDYLRAQGRFAAICQKGEQVRTSVIPKLLGALECQPVLLHGDLWSGNMGQSGDGEPVIFDPASYYGHNEADLAIARIFGGVPRSFFDSYHLYRPKTAPVEQYELRSHLYQLFHYLNHTVMFGGHYARSAEQKMDTLLAASL